MLLSLSRQALPHSTSDHSPLSSNHMQLSLITAHQQHYKAHSHTTVGVWPRQSIQTYLPALHTWGFFSLPNWTLPGHLQSSKSSLKSSQSSPCQVSYILVLFVSQCVVVQPASNQKKNTISLSITFFWNHLPKFLLT